MLNISKELTPIHHGPGRKFQRRLYFTSIEYIVNNRIYRDFTRDISNGGLYIITQYNHQLSDHVTAIFIPPSEKNHILCTGKIVRTTPSGFGLKFNCIWNFHEDYPDDFF